MLRMLLAATLVYGVLFYDFNKDQPVQRENCFDPVRFGFCVGEY